MIGEFLSKLNHTHRSLNLFFFFFLKFTLTFRLKIRRYPTINLLGWRDIRQNIDSSSFPKFSLGTMTKRREVEEYHCSFRFCTKNSDRQFHPEECLSRQRWCTPTHAYLDVFYPNLRGMSRIDKNTNDQRE